MLFRSANGYVLLLACHDFDLKNEVKVARSLIERGVDGIVLIGAEHDDALFSLLDDLALPYLLTWALDMTARHPCVGFDNRAAAARVANYLESFRAQSVGFDEVAPGFDFITQLDRPARSIPNGRP